MKVYLNSRGGYVNGKSVSKSELTTIITESGLSQAVLSAELYLSAEQIEGWETVIRKAGIEKIERTAPK